MLWILELQVRPGGRRDQIGNQDTGEHKHERSMNRLKAKWSFGSVVQNTFWCDIN